MLRSRKPAPVARFDPGAKVRVKPGVRDPDFPDIPLGGWSGTVQEVHQFQGTTTYLIAWDERTLGRIHPVYRNRCERDGLDHQTMGLGEEDIEPDEGAPIAIERPPQIVTKPLSEKDQEDRIRMVFGLTHDDLLPEVNHETLLSYYRYLSEHLKFPFQGRYNKRIGWSRRVPMPLILTGLLGPDECEIAAEFGIIGTGRDAEEKVDFPLSEVEDIRDRHNRLIKDYVPWFVNWA
jgi:hypothetical protein